MTIVTMYKNKQNAVFVSDFRNTSKINAGNKKIYQDDSVKFVPIGETMGMYLAGDVLGWKKVIERLNNNISKIKFEEITEDYGILKSCLLDVILNYNHMDLYAIGFILDTENNQNKIFEVRGANITEILDDECIKVIGANKVSKEIENNIRKIIPKLLEFEDIYHLGCLIRNEIKTYIENSKYSFKELGISPYMNIGILINDYFHLCGEEIWGERFNSYDVNQFNYCLKRNNTEVLLVNNIDNKVIKLKNIENVTSGSKNNIFDPEMIE